MEKDTLLLTERSLGDKKQDFLTLALTAKERTQLRGRRLTSRGVAVILQLPRGPKLLPGEILQGETHKFIVQVQAANEKLLRIRAKSKASLIRAAYHLGNRHVQVEILENELFILEDLVMHKMLERLRFNIERVKREFSPEVGAYD